MRNAVIECYPFKLHTTPLIHVCHHLQCHCRLFNALINDLREDGLGWRSTSFAASDGHKFVNDLHDLLWYVSCHWEQFKDGGCSLPEAFSKYKDWNKHKGKGKPRLDLNSLNKKTFAVLITCPIKGCLGQGLRPCVVVAHG